MKKFILWFIGICAGLLLGAWLLLVILQHTVAAWPEPVPGVRLEPRRPILAEADVKPDNAYYYIRQMTNTELKGDVFLKEAARWDASGVDGGPYPAFESDLKAYKKDLEAVHTSVELPDCQMPTIIGWEEKIPWFRSSTNNAQLLLYRAEIAAKCGDWKRVSSDICTVLVLGNYITRGGNLIHRFMGVKLHSMATCNLRRITVNWEIPAEFQQEMDAALKSAEHDLEPLDEAMRYDRKMVSGLLDKEVYTDAFWKTVGEKRSYPPWFVRFILFVYGSNFSQTRKHIDAVYTHSIAACANIANTSISQDILNRIIIKTGPRKLINDPIGRAVVADVWIDIGFAWRKVIGEQSNLRATRLVLAIRRWQLEHDGKLPGTFAELVPGYISAIPEDPFSPKHEPLRYRTDGTAWAVYSVGKDGVDNGGRFSELDKEDKSQHPNELDLVFASDEFQKKRAAYEKQQK